MFQSKQKKSPLKAARQFCMECMNGYTELISTCVADGYKSKRVCALYEYRFGKTERGAYPDVPILKAIRLQCLECVGTYMEVENCSCSECALFKFRFGDNPFTRNVGSPHIQKGIFGIIRDQAN